VNTVPDVILVGGTTALIPAQKATRTIPIVFVGSADPVGQGFVERLPRPGGNMTGFTIFEVSLIGKNAGGAKADSARYSASGADL
jgi:putative tryptophan/tyrosine transport system substrate-binding protein